MKEAVLKFSLSMPNIGSWNGKWSGSSGNYFRLVRMGRSKLSHEKAAEFVGSYFYNFGDGWSASVSVELVTLSDMKGKKSDGFYSYDWMIKSILKNKKITTE